MFRVNRRTEAPPSLALRKKYDGEDVVNALEEDFHGKCYICETKDLTSLNVEHFKSHKGVDEDLMYSWDNLFYSCARCNNFKRHLFDDIIDCTDLSFDVCRAIKHVFPTTPFSGSVVIEPQYSDVKTLNTSNLIRNIFNDTNTGNKGITVVSLKKRVFAQYNIFLEYLNTYLDPQSLPKDKKSALEHLKHMMSVEQEYSAFLRWAVIDSPKLYDLLGCDEIFNHS